MEAAYLGETLPQKPPATADEEWRQVWLLWFTLHYLFVKSQKEGVDSVSATELRQVVLDQLPNPDDPKTKHKRDEIIEVLTGTMALVRTNVSGYRSRRYFMTEEVGRLLMKA